MKNSDNKNRTYCYKGTSVEDNSKTSIFEIEVGKDGVTLAHLEVLRAMDDFERLQVDRDVRNIDWEFENHRRRNHETDRDEDPFDMIPDCSRTVKPMTSDEEAVRRALETLTPDQQNLLYEIFGSCTSEADIARREDVSRAAITRRKNRALESLKKAFFRDR